MALLNLTLAEFLAILLPLSGLVVALYFYDQSRKRRVVSSLRFWPRIATPPMTTRRRKLQQPLSLLLQLLALLLLILAIADLRIGDEAGPRPHHVVILETSARMNAQATSGATLMDVAQRHALAYLQAIPAGDPVMLIRTGVAPTPITGFTTDRGQLEEAIGNSTPGWTAADLAGSLELARSSLELVAAGSGDSGSGDLAASRAIGEVAFIGSGRVPETGVGRIRTAGIPRLRYISVGDGARDAGIRRFAAQLRLEDPTRWQVVGEVFNYDASPRQLRLDFSLDDQRLGGKSVRAEPGSGEEILFHLRAERGGVLRAELLNDDDFGGNDQAWLRLPRRKRYPIHVYSSQPAPWRALLTPLSYLEPGFHDASGDQPASERQGLQLFDRVVPDPTAAGIYFDPPAKASPVPVSKVVRGVRVTRWLSSHPLAEGLHDKDVVLPQASVFQPASTDVVIAETDAGPVIVARSTNGEKQVLYGFHPAASRLAHRLVTPLLFANAIRWFVPEAFRRAEMTAGSPGVVETTIDAEEQKEIEIISSENPNLPWTIADDRLRFFAARPGSVTVRSPQRESVFTLTLPEVGAAQWEPPEGTLRGVPPPTRGVAAETVALWPWLALAALGCLTVEWRLFGRLAPPVGVRSVPRREPADASTRILGPLESTEREAREEQVTR